MKRCSWLGMCSTAGDTVKTPSPPTSAAPSRAPAAAPEPSLLSLAGVAMVLLLREALFGFFPRASPSSAPASPLRRMSTVTWHATLNGLISLKRSDRSPTAGPEAAATADDDA